MIDELMAAGQYAAALEKLADLSDEEVRLKRLICLNSLGEFEKAKLEGKAAKAVAKETYYDVVGQYIMSLKECEDYEEAINIPIEEFFKYQ